jgi:hypothetical protein
LILPDTCIKSRQNRAIAIMFYSHPKGKNERCLWGNAP